MSSPLLASDVLFFQRVLKIAKFYTGPLDGKLTPSVDQAEAAFEADYASTRDASGVLDPRSERNIATLLPSAQKKAREFMAAAKSFGPECRIISGTRTYAEQDQLFAIGRTIQMDRKPVTNAKGGQSNHNFGVAWDIGLFDQGRYMDGAKKGDEQAYVDLAKLVKSKVSGIEWGGDWKTFPDNPHYQLPTGLKIAEVRSRFEAGTAFA